MLHNGRSEWLQTKASPAFITLTIPLFLSNKRRKPIHADPEIETTLKDLDKLLKTSPNLTEPRYPEVEAHATDRNRLHLLRHTSSPESQHGAKVLEQWIQQRRGTQAETMLNLTKVNTKAEDPEAEENWKPPVIHTS